jgi:flagellar basal-body rod protein FlgG
MGIVELGGVIIAQATQRVELAAQNMANMTTAGYKSQRFQTLVNAQAGVAPSGLASSPAEMSVDFTAGKLQHTGNPFDLAVADGGFFTVRLDDQILYTRAGQFVRDAQGRLINSEGAVLQSTGGDVHLEKGEVSVLPDGTLAQGSQPISQLAIAAFDDPHVLKPVGASMFSAPPGAARDGAGSQIRQGMLESSNVTTADEMVSMMAALRSAETGQRLVQVYDDLMGRVITAFGQT